jgi:hypothetical protein
MPPIAETACTNDAALARYDEALERVRFEASAEARAELERAWRALTVVTIADLDEVCAEVLQDYCGRPPQVAVRRMMHLLELRARPR